MIGKATKKNSTRANQIALIDIIFGSFLTRITSIFISKNTNKKGNPHNRDSKLSTISESNLQVFYIHLRNFRSNDPYKSTNYNWISLFQEMKQWRSSVKNP